MEILVFIIAFVLCFAVGNFAENKGRSYWKAFFLSLLLSPLIGFIVVALLDKSDEKKREEIRLVEEVKNDVNQYAQKSKNQLISNEVLTLAKEYEGLKVGKKYSVAKYLSDDNVKLDGINEVISLDHFQEFIDVIKERKGIPKEFMHKLIAIRNSKNLIKDKIYYGKRNEDHPEFFDIYQIDQLIHESYFKSV